MARRGTVTALALILGPMLGCDDQQRPAPAPHPSAVPEQTATMPSTPPSPRPAPTPPTEPARSCTLSLSPRGGGAMAVSIVLENRTAEPMVAAYHHPLLFALEIWAGAERLELQIPAFDGPVQRRTVEVPPGERVTVPTPVTLRFAPDGKPETSSPFEWLIVSPPRDVRLVARRVFSDTPELICEGTLPRSGR